MAALLWLHGNAQHNVTAIPFVKASVRPEIADRVNGKPLFSINKLYINYIFIYLLVCYESKMYVV